MNPPLVGLPPLEGLTGFAVTVALGMAFGALLEQAGLGDARKLSGQFYFTDLTVFKVMFSAIITALLGTFWLSRVGVLDLGAIYVPDTFAAPDLLGGVVFGVGMVMAGLCPGTSCVALSSGRRDGVAVALGMCAGIVLFNELYPALAPFYRSTPMGPITLPRLFGLPEGTVVLGVVMAGLLGFRGAEWIENRRGDAP